MNNYFQELPLEITFIICSYSKSKEVAGILNLIPDLLDRAETTIKQVFMRLIKSYQPTINFRLIHNYPAVYDIISGYDGILTHQKLLMIAGGFQYKSYSN